ncbi:MAG: zinc-binding dehydrogenase, partial [Actinobacteria bacterium]|nr:zinc-binding dehydrogenase [Actinomycetota bacterium]
IQLARRAGARVIGAARGEHKLRAARDLGADATIDYGKDDWPARLLDLTGGHGADLIFDGVGGTIGHRCLSLTAPAGRFVAYGAPSGDFTRPGTGDRPATVLSLLDLTTPPGADRRRTEQALAATAAGRLTPVIGQTLPLHRAADAHTAIEARAVTGKTLLLT